MILSIMSTHYDFEKRQQILSSSFTFFAKGYLEMVKTFSINWSLK